MINLKKYMVRSKKGQAFSTFQLLIAAVVALALLGVLMPIIMQALGFIQSDPVDTTKQLLQSAYDSRGTLKTTQKVTFSTNQNELSSDGLSEGTGIGHDQIFFIKNNLDGFNILGDNQSVLRYTKAEKINYYMNVFCNYGDRIEDSLDVRSINYEGAENYINNLDDSIIYCAVFPTRAN